MARATSLACSRWVRALAASMSVRHRVAVVDHDDIERRLAAEGGEGGLFAPHRPGEGEAQEEQDEAARGQQKPLFETETAAVFPHGAKEEFHRRPGDGLKAPAVEDVDDDRDGCEQRPGGDKAGTNKAESEDGGEGKAHHEFYFIDAERLARKPLNETSRGSPVFMRVKSMCIPRHIF